jgi:outer membrane protein OmpA-like peptidoglycan-associated protein
MPSAISKTCLIAAALISIITGLNAQQMSSGNEKARGFFTAAHRQYGGGNMQAAAASLEKAIAADSMFTEAYQLQADIYNATADYAKESEAYGKLISYGLADEPRVYYLLGISQYRQGQYKPSRDNLHKALIDGRMTARLREEVRKAISLSDFAMRQVSAPHPYHVKSIGCNINTQHNDYWPSLTADSKTMVYTVELPSGYRDVHGGIKYQEDIYASIAGGSGKWEKSGPAQGNINTPDNEGSQSISFNGQFIFYTSCNRTGGKGSCDIYMSEKNGSEWMQAVNLGEPVNTRYWESQPSLSADGQSLYFASNRPGGYGGMDIWVSRLSEHGLWAEPENLGDSINTPGDEHSPFIHYDNTTLYFSSNGWPGLGGQDIFMSRRASGGWERPENLGYPLNTHNDEIGFVLNAQGDKAYFAAEREGSQKKDIYEVNVPDKFRPKPVSYVKGMIVDYDTKEEIKADFELSDLSTSNTLSRSTSIQGSGEYLVCLPLDTDLGLNVSKKGYLFHSQNFSLGAGSAGKPLDINISLQTIQVGRKEVLRNVFYDTDIFTLDNRSLAELQHLLQFMETNTNVKIEIGGHTDSQGSEQHNAKLSENRARLVYQFLINSGIEPGRLSFQGYGPSQPVAPNNTASGRAQNRRTEFKITEIK